MGCFVVSPNEPFNVSRETYYLRLIPIYSHTQSTRDRDSYTNFAACNTVHCAGTIEDKEKSQREVVVPLHLHFGRPSLSAPPTPPLGRLNVSSDGVCVGVLSKQTND